MANRIYFWKMKANVDVSLPPERPVGQAIVDTVRRGEMSDYLQPFPAKEFLERLRQVFPNSTVEEDGGVNWNDDSENGFYAVAGGQHVEVCEFDMNDADVDRLFGVMEEFDADYFS